MEDSIERQLLQSCERVLKENIEMENNSKQKRTRNSKKQDKYNKYTITNKKNINCIKQKIIKKEFFFKIK